MISQSGCDTPAGGLLTTTAGAGGSNWGSVGAALAANAMAGAEGTAGGIVGLCGKLLFLAAFSCSIAVYLPLRRAYSCAFGPSPPSRKNRAGRNNATTSAFTRTRVNS